MKKILISLLLISGLSYQPSQALDIKKAQKIALSMGVLAGGLSYSKVHKNELMYPGIFSSLCGLFVAGVTYLLIKEDSAQQKYYKALEYIEDALHYNYAISNLSKQEILTQFKESFNYHKSWLNSGLIATRKELDNAHAAKKLLQDVIKSNQELRNNAEKMLVTTTNLIINLDFTLACLEITDIAHTINDFQLNKLATAVIAENNILKVVKQYYGDSKNPDAQYWLLNVFEQIKKDINSLNSYISFLQNIRKKNYNALASEIEELLNKTMKMSANLKKIMNYIKQSSEYIQQLKQLDSEKERTIQIENDRRLAMRLAAQ